MWEITVTKECEACTVYDIVEKVLITLLRQDIQTHAEHQHSIRDGRGQRYAVFEGLEHQLLMAQ